MAYFNEIRIHDQTKNSFAALWPAASCTIDLFTKLIKRRLVTSNARYVNVYIEDGSVDHLDYSIMAGFVTIDYDYRKIKLSKSANDYAKKKIVLDLIYEVLCHLAVKEGWDIDVIMDVYNQCLKMKIQNERWFKDKLFAAPGKTYYAGLHQVYDLNGYQVFLVLFDKSTKELIRHLVFKDVFETYEVQRFAWKKDAIHYKFTGAKKVFVYTVEELLQSKVKKVPKNIELLFK